MNLKLIDGYDGRYAIQDDGTVYSYVQKHTGKPISPAYCSNGYTMVGPVSSDGKRKHELIHRLVAVAFVPNPENKPHVNHKNGIKDDNRAENLEWCDRSYNMKHAYKTGLCTSLKRLSPEQADKARELYNNRNFTQNQLAEIYCVGRATIGRVINKVGY